MCSLKVHNPIEALVQRARGLLGTEREAHENRYPHAPAARRALGIGNGAGTQSRSRLWQLQHIRPYSVERDLQPTPVAGCPALRRGPGMVDLFAGGREKSTQFGAAFEAVTAATGIAFYNAAEAVVETDGADGILLTADEHLALGTAIAEQVRALLSGQN